MGKGEYLLECNNLLRKNNYPVFYSKNVKSAVHLKCYQKLLEKTEHNKKSHIEVTTFNKIQNTKLVVV